MRVINTIYIISAIICLALATETKEEKDNQFFQGMETGFFLRKNPKGYKDYECPDLPIDTELTKQINEVFAPMKMMVSLAKDATLDATMDLVSLFIDEIQALQAASNNYSGSDFCSGVVYGIHGSRLIIEIGKHMVNVVQTFIK